MGQGKEMEANKKQTVTEFCDKCQTEKPLSEFYDYRGLGGLLMKPCRKCKKEMYNLRFRANKRKDVAGFVSLLKSVSIDQRAGSLLALVNKGTVNETQFKTILREVEF